MNGNYRQQIVQMLQGMPRPQMRPPMQQVQPPPAMPNPAATTPRMPITQPGPMPPKPPVKRGY